MVDDIPVYVSGSPGPRGVVLYQEIFGLNSGNLKRICDELAAAGFFAVMMDNFRGKVCPEDGAIGKGSMTVKLINPPRSGPLACLAMTLGPYIPGCCLPALPPMAATLKEASTFFRQFPYSTVIGPDTEKVLKWMEAKGCTSVGAMGFCWGVWALCKASAEGLPFKCGVGPHPSTQVEAIFGNEKEMIDKVRMPVLLMAAGNDPPILRPGGDIAEALVKKGGTSKWFPEMKHGWMGRGDTSKPDVRRDFEEGMRLTIAHFNQHL
eukprot:CAMPEP_0115257826 /NCGR_PEP_ID=MMETSP0270-20121206/46975_1 /TAXON_ID=71861 /ORGANISM="Scrippsiella trochoidea, Strain CCMP3099" /LENGTH=263 /DNA_ID=CAMNT_0002673549 /DNA_START=196 /DNA_END=987 /DNA_ORIENTATION=-